VIGYQGRQLRLSVRADPRPKRLEGSGVGINRNHGVRNIVDEIRKVD
jgi:hypothetical protein